MLQLKPVDGKNVWDIIRLSVAPSQTHFVAANDISIIEAYIALIGGGHAFPFGIFHDNEPVGFLMVSYGTDDYWDDAPAIADRNYSLMRLMIDERYQGQGYGRAALELALQFIRSFPCGKAASCWLSYEPENEVARRLYHSFGFRETNELDGNEVIAVLAL